MVVPGLKDRQVIVDNEVDESVLRVIRRDRCRPARISRAWLIESSGGDRQASAMNLLIRFSTAR
ncbi:hypothetical protein A5675_05845 [Mycobacterium malmoense]|nr:hypothetical protein A5675_05845 [Mycobacterium malmoense]